MEKKRGKTEREKRRESKDSEEDKWRERERKEKGKIDRERERIRSFREEEKWSKKKEKGKTQKKRESRDSDEEKEKGKIERGRERDHPQYRFSMPQEIKKSHQLAIIIDKTCCVIKGQGLGA